MLLVISVILSLFCISVVAYEVFGPSASFGAFQGTVCLKSLHLAQYLEFKPHCHYCVMKLKQDGIKYESRNIIQEQFDIVWTIYHFAIYL